MIVWITAALLVILHLTYTLAAPQQQVLVMWDFALAPQRFWAPAGSASDRSTKRLSSAT